jgi:hypothetical protein
MHLEEVYWGDTPHLFVEVHYKKLHGFVLPIDIVSERGSLADRLVGKTEQN